MQRLLAQKNMLTRFTYATKQVEFFFAANAGNFILPITAMAGAVSLARTMTDPVASRRSSTPCATILMESF